MIELNAHFDGKVIVPDEPLSLAPSQKIRISIEPIGPDAAQSGTKPKRVFGQQRGVVLYMAPDFNDDLGDEFWGLAEEKQK